MKRSLMRPTAALLPLAGAIVSVVGDAVLPTVFFLFYFMMQCFSLAAVDCFRNAAAREPGLRRVDRRFGGALLPLLVGIGLPVGAGIYAAFQKDAYLILPIILAAGCMIIEQLFEERMDAVGKGMDVALMQLISAVLLFAGMMLDGLWDASDDMPCYFTMGASALSMLIAAIASLATEPLHGFSIAPRNLGFFPKAMVQSLLYPVAMCAYFILQSGRGEDAIAAMEEFMVLPLMLGMIPWRLSRTVCRRSSDESRPLNLLLVSLAAVSVIIAAAGNEYIFRWYYGDIARFCAEAMILAAICSAAVFSAPGWRIYTGLVLLALSMLRFDYYVPGDPYVRFALCLAAVILNTKKAFLKKV